MKAKRKDAVEVNSAFPVYGVLFCGRIRQFGDDLIQQLEMGSEAADFAVCSF